ncbi:MAG: hypothetical protein KDA99_07435, partial [Planctomycetales bacterium]|nr:hypothetical protein [Planctomycetales bacterium]
VHAALVRKVARGKRVHCPELIGKDENGRPLNGSHEHAHVLSLDLDGDGHLDHILIHAQMGLGAAAQAAIRSLDRTWTKGGVADLQVAVAGVGEAGQLTTLHGTIGRSARSLMGHSGSSAMSASGAHVGESLRDSQSTENGNSDPVSEGPGYTLLRSRRDRATFQAASVEKSVWQSITPFVPPRFVKRSGKNSLEGQVNAELASRELPPAVRVEILDNESKAFRHFVRVRRRGENPPLPPVDMGLALRLEFDRPLPAPSLPLALGYAIHFGLGLFAMKDEE